jgi:hypothetical protein
VRADNQKLLKPELEKQQFKAEKDKFETKSTTG